MRWPGVLPEGGTSSQVALTMDMLPTFLAAAGVAPPAGRKLDGVNLLPVLGGEREPFPRTVFWRYKRYDNRRKAVRHGYMKYVLDNGSEELHNLAGDEREQENLIDEMPDVAADLKMKLEDWEEEVRAPRLAAFPGSAG